MVKQSIIKVLLVSMQEMNVFKRIALACIGLLAAVLSYAQDVTFCNPLNLEYRWNEDNGAYREAADPMVVLYKDDYYLFASKSGGYWWSDDMSNWQLVRPVGIDIEKYAPAAWVLNDELYYTSSESGHIYKTSDPKRGIWQKVCDNPHPWNDPRVFVDDDGRVYAYWGSAENVAISCCELDPKNNFRPLTEDIVCFRTDSEHNGYEVAGEENEGGAPWTEGPAMLKSGGMYYLTYAVPGTQLRSYCDGYYVSDSPTGPFTLGSNSPCTRKSTGFVTGTGHGGLFRDKAGKLWSIDCVAVSKKHWFERRLAIFPAEINDDGLLHVNTAQGDYPISLAEGAPTGWQLLSQGKSATASSTDQDNTPDMAFDENLRTWWSAQTGHKGEWLQVDLGNVCKIYAVQTNLYEVGANALTSKPAAIRYVIDVSQDGMKWRRVADCAREKGQLTHGYHELPTPVEARYVRITNRAQMPAGGKFAASGLRVFGLASGLKPAVVTGLAIERLQDQRQAVVRWQQAKGAEGYIVRYGIAPDKLWNHYQLWGADQTSLIIRSLIVGTPYYYRVDAVNGAGLTEGMQTVQDVFSNPVVYADCPDPDIIRVGETFYMVSTTMHFAPGCQIMKSRDLVNWQAIGFAYDQLEEDDRFALRNGQDDYARGSWAANLRYDPYERRFYLIVSCNTTEKSYIFTTQDIEHGPWHRNVVDLCYDPGLLFDDTGTECRKYVVHPDYSLEEHRAHMRPIISDGKGGVTLGSDCIIIDYTQAENPSEGLRAEGYHAYKIGDYYYIFMIQGQSWQRQEIVWRSLSLEPGSWECRKVFAGNIVNADGTDYMPFTGVAQGGVVDMADGQWYAFLFQDYGAVGRIPVLLPMKWDKDGWPIIGNDGKSVDRVLPMPVAGQPATFPAASDEFDNRQPYYAISDSPSQHPEYQPNGSVLRPEWQWNHNPDNRYWSLTDRKGWLRLKSGWIVKGIRDARNTLTQRTVGPWSAAHTRVDVSGLRNGDCAGLASYQNQYGFVGVERCDDQLRIVMRRARQKGDAEGVMVASIPLSQNVVYLKVCCDFRNKTDKAIFFYSLDGQDWHSIGDALQMAFDWPDFVGQRFALFYYSTEQCGGHADFDFYKVNYHN